MNTELLIATFNENISYIEKQQPELFSKLVALDNAVANGHYQEKYELVFDNGYFDVLEKQTNNYLYGQNSDEYATLAARSIDYNVEDNLFICSPEHKIDDAALKYYKALPPLKDYLSGMAPILHFIGQRVDETKALKSLEKFIFFGVGLGLHIASIHKKIGAKEYLIVEDDLELFRLSLFTTNYNRLSEEAKLYFTVFDDKEEFAIQSELFLKESYEHNHYVKYFEMLSHSEEKRKAFHLSVAQQSHLRFSYASMLTQNLLPLESLFGSYKFLKRDITLLGTGLEKKPFLLLAAGPSLEKMVDVLQEKAKSFVVVAVSAILPLLEKIGVVPDIIVHLDSFDTSVRHFESLHSLDFIKNSLYLFSAKTTPLILKRLKKENIFLYEDSITYKKNSFRPSSPCVGSLAYQILLYLKVENIFLLGVDLAVDSESGKTHSQSHIYAKKLDIQEQNSDDKEIGYKDYLFNVDGNRGESVLTTPHFKASIDAINYTTQKVKNENQVIKNLGDGAKFNSVEAMRLNEVHLNTLTPKIYRELKEVFDQYTLEGITQEEKSSLEAKVTYARAVREKLYEYTTLQSKSVEEFKKNLLLLVKDISSDDANDLCRVFDTYFKYLLPYIFDYLNREDINIGKKEFDTLNTMLVEHLMQIS